MHDFKKIIKIIKIISTLLQIKLLEGMDNMIKMTKGNAETEYDQTKEENDHYETFKYKLVKLQPQSQEMHSFGGGSKCKRRSKRRRQRNQQKRRQKSKKYCK
jgi:hypothetical protein